MRNKFQKMKSFKSSLFILFILLIQSSFAQYFEFNWSEKLKYGNNKSGFYSGIINANALNIYILNSNLAVSPLQKNAKLKITSYNKSTMVEVASVSLRGYPENGPLISEYASLDYFKTIVLEGKILVFWKKLINTDSTKTEEIYAESFKLDLERDKQIRKIYSITEKVAERQSEFSETNLVVTSNNKNDNVLIGSEIQQKGDSIAFKYQILSSQLSLSSANQVFLQSRIEGEKNGLTASYEYATDGNIYIRSTYTYTREEYRKVAQNESRSFLIMTVINPLSKDKITVELKGENKTITDYCYLFTPTKTKIYGFFGDLAKDPTGIDKQGLFYTEIDNDTLTKATLNYSYFEKTTLSKLFPKSKGGRKKILPVDQQAKEEELKTRFDIENIFLMEDGSATLFFTRKYNYAEITSKSGIDGKNMYTTDLYCEKNNVSAIRISEAGKIAWTSNLDRSITYKGTDVADVKVMYKLNKFYVIYGTENTEGEEIKNKERTTEYSDQIEYATFDPITGRAKKNVLLVNDKDVEKSDVKLVNQQTISVYGDNFYFNNLIQKQKTGWLIANILCFPTIYYTVLTGNTKQASGHLGVVCLQPGKPSKKKTEKK